MIVSQYPVIAKGWSSFNRKVVIFCCLYNWVLWGFKRIVSKSVVMFYGSVVWDPWLIVAQIVCIQCLYYLTVGVFLTILVGTRVSRMSLVYFFDYAAVTVSTVTGWCVIASFLLSSIVGAGFLLYVIERAKKVPRFFSHTLHNPFRHMHLIWRLAFINNMVGCQWYWTGNNGFVRRIFMYKTRITRNSYFKNQIKLERELRFPHVGRNLEVAWR